MTPQQLGALAQQKRSLLCVGLDPSGEAFGEEPSLTEAERRLHAVIEKTAPFAIAYKLNTAFYERWGESGWALMRRLRAALPPDTLSIADAKRGDIAHTSQYYARALYEDLGFDAVTLHPYMGWQGLKPFLQYPERWAFVLLRTTEAPAWQSRVWREILSEAPASPSTTLGWVWGAHHTSEIQELRRLRTQDWLLIPGLGAQQGQVEGNATIYPALLVVGRALLREPHRAPEWAQRTASYLPASEATGRFELP